MAFDGEQDDSGNHHCHHTYTDDDEALSVNSELTFENGHSGAVFNNSERGGRSLMMDDDSVSTSQDQHHPYHHNRTSSIMCGREKELAQLKDCYDQVRGKLRAQAVLISGESGMGKSKLVETLRPHVTTGGGFLCVGKFEQQLIASNLPFSALGNALSDAIDFILNEERQDPPFVEERRRAVEDALGGEVRTLARFVSNLAQLVPRANLLDSKTDDSSSSNHDLSSKGVHLPTLFRTFLQSLATKEHPILFALDDLQWMDRESSEVFQAFMTDASLNNVLIVGSFRSDETSASEILSDIDPSQHHQIATTCIELKGLGESELSILVSRYFENAPAQMLDDLSHLLKQKSGGNPLFSMELLNFFVEKRLVNYDETTMEWVWNQQELITETEMSPSLIVLVTERMRALPRDILSSLKFLSCISYRFDIDIVSHIARYLTKENHEALKSFPGMTVSSLSLAVNKAVKEGLLEKSCSDSFIYNFAHDRLQQALYQMIESPEKGLQSIHYAIGSALAASPPLLNGDVSRSLTFVMVDQLNSGLSEGISEEERTDLARKNYDAGCLASQRSAFWASTTYLRKARELLRDPKYWIREYRFMLDLCSALGEAEVRSGEFNASRRSCQEVLDNVTNLDDKLKAMVIHVQSYQSQERLQDTVDHGVRFLRMLGIRMTKSPGIASVLMSYVKLRVKLRGFTDAQILSLPKISNSKMTAALDLIDYVAVAAFFMQTKGELFILAIIRAISASLKYGLCNWSGVAFGGLSVLCSTLNDRKLATRFGRLAVAIQQRLTSPIAESRVICIVQHYSFPWDQSLLSCCEHFKRGVLIGKQTGELEWAYLNVAGLVSTMFIAGCNLHEILQYSREYGAEMKEFQVWSSLRVTGGFWQMTANLMGEDPNTSKLTGEAMDEDKVIKDAVENKNFIALAAVNATRLMTSVFFADFKRAELICPEMEKGLHFQDGNIASFFSRLFLGLSFVESCFRSQLSKKRVLRKLRQYHKRIKAWSDGGVDSCVPITHILEAEIAFVSDHKRECSSEKDALVLETYRTAVQTSADLGMPHLAALSNERAAFASYRVNDKRAAREFMRKAEQSYAEWGAAAKAEQINRFLGNEHADIEQLNYYS